MFELLGPSVDAVIGDYQEAEDHLDPKTVLKISKQLLQGLAFVHEAGYAHGGMMVHDLFVILLFPESKQLDLFCL